MKSRSSLLGQILLGTSIMGIALVMPGVALAAPPTPLDPGSGNAARLADLFWLILAIAIPVFVITEGLLIFALVRYRRRYDDEMPEQVHGNNTLELLWTVIPALIMVALFVITMNSLVAERETPEDTYVVEVIGHQWFWEFRYPETEITIFSTSDDLYIPAGETVEFQVTGSDVIHSFWIPQLAGKRDAIPGHVQSFWMTAEEGVYPGQCAEFCGLEHYAMLFDTYAVSRNEFDTWMAQKVEAKSNVIGQPDTETLLPPGNAAVGEQLFIELGCNSCHTLDGSQLVGPSLLGIEQRAGGRVPGQTVEQYINSSIQLPCDYLVPGFTCVMPQNFSERVTYQDLSDMIAFLLEQ